MSDARFERTRLLIGQEDAERLRGAHVGVMGLGGVGGYVVEALARAGVGHLYLVDGDVIEITNLNRQILALDETIGQPKVAAARARIEQINPAATVETRHQFISPANVAELIPADIEYAVEAIDTIGSKVALLAALYRRGVATVSCMGAARRTDPTRVKVADIAATQGCPLARRVRVALRQEGIASGIMCVYSEETPSASTEGAEQRPPNDKRAPLGSISYLPGIVGLMAAGAMIDMIRKTAPAK